MRVPRAGFNGSGLARRVPGTSRTGAKPAKLAEDLDAQSHPIACVVANWRLKPVPDTGFFCRLVEIGV